MHIRITNSPRFEVPLTLAHITALTVLSECHYDATCKSVSRQGGFLFGWANWANDAAYENTVTATFDQIQTVSKLLELLSQAHHSKLVDDAAVKLCRDLQRSLHGAISLANENFHEWQAVFSG
jgi:hypothetical protein